MANEYVGRYFSGGIQRTCSSLFIKPVRPSFKEEAEKQPSPSLFMGMKIKTVSAFGMSVGNFYQNPKYRYSLA